MEATLIHFCAGQMRIHRFFSPVRRSSTFIEFSIASTRSGNFFLCKFKWWAMMALKIEGEGQRPNGNLLNRKCISLLSISWGFSNQRNRSISWSCSEIPIMRDPFSMSAVSATECHLNLFNTSKICKQSANRSANSPSLISHLRLILLIHCKRCAPLSFPSFHASVSCHVCLW